MNSIAAIVVTYNRKELLLNCVANLRGQENAACDVILIDNASTDGTWEVSRPLLDEGIRYFRLEENTGGAGGFYFGMKKALELGYSYLWLMDDDTQAFPDALANLLEADRLLEGSYGFLSSTALWTDGTICRMNRQKIAKIQYEKKEPTTIDIVPIYQATFVSFFVQAQTVYRFGFPIKEFFIWGDDIEYSRRIAVRGGQAGYLVNQSRVVHAMKDNTGSNIAIDRVERLWRYAYAYRNEYYLYRQEGVWGVCHYIARCGRDFFRILLTARGHRIIRWKVLFSSIWHGFLFHPQVEHCSIQDSGNAD